MKLINQNNYLTRKSVEETAASILKIFEIQKKK